MLVSTPHPSKPDEARDARIAFRAWIDDLKAKRKVIHFYYRVGRGIAAVLDVESNDELHTIMTQWGNIVPVTFDVYPLVSPSGAEGVLKKGKE